MEAGEYFQSQSKKRQRAEQDRAEQQVEKAAQRQKQRQAAFQPPEVRELGWHRRAYHLPLGSSVPTGHPVVCCA